MPRVYRKRPKTNPGAYRYSGSHGGWVKFGPGPKKKRKR